MRKSIPATFIIAAFAVVSSHAQGSSIERSAKRTPASILSPKSNVNSGDSKIARNEKFSKDDSRYSENNWRNNRDNSSKRITNSYSVRSETETVWINGKPYIETYQIKTLRNGRTTSKLINRQELRAPFRNAKFRNRNSQSRFEYATVWENGRKYRVTYRITSSRNGRTHSEVIDRRLIN
ncbi:MAG: hypothetical protein ACK5NT_12020 [Pyrinomonadaceae bacterium]